MRAVLFTSYGPPDLLRIGDVEQPVPRRGEILVPVLAKARGIRWSKPSSEEPTQEHAELLKELLESGRIVSEIEQTYPLEEVLKAMRHIEIGHARAKLVVTI